MRYKIIGIRYDGTEDHLFTWTRDPAAGIEHAKREADDLGEQYRDYRADPI